MFGNLVIMVIFLAIIWMHHTRWLRKLLHINDTHLLIVGGKTSLFKNSLKAVHVLIGNIFKRLWIRFCHSSGLNKWL